MLAHSITRLNLRPLTTGGGQADQTSDGVWRLSIPAGPAGRYRLAQLDDYLRLPRRSFLWRPPLTLEMDARVSHPDLPGTWGFGFWNDPFNASLGIGGTARRLPALPNTAWFFHASPPNYLALCDDHPAQGLLAAGFSSPNLHTFLFIPGLPFLPLLAWKPTARLLRRFARRFIQETAAAVDLDATEWHHYRIELSEKSTVFYVDDCLQFKADLAPRGPLGLVLWIDNQFAAFPPDGRLRFGTLASEMDAWLELAHIEIQQPL